MDANLARLQQFFDERGYASPDIPLLQPADPFLDTAGEDLRRRVFMTSDLAGASLCLRPEFTIPVCLAHLNGGAANGNYAYGGSVFRQRKAGPAEFLQAGMESIGGETNPATDVDCIATALDALKHCGAANLNIVFGDQAIFEALLLALELPAPWRARLGRAFGDPEKIENDLHIIGGHDTHSDKQLSHVDENLHKALDQSDRREVERLIALKMAEANLPTSGGRTAFHISQRLIAKAELSASQLSEEQRQILKTFLAIEVPVERAIGELRDFSSSLPNNIDAAIEAFALRAALLAQNASENVSITWRASFGRRLDYYTGIVFEIFEPNAKRPVCGGGRYDRLMNILGAGKSTPAIGFSIWLDRLVGAIK